MSPNHLAYQPYFKLKIFYFQATDDKNKDGYIDYPEFVQAQQAAQARQAQAPM